MTDIEESDDIWTSYAETTGRLDRSGFQGRLWNMVKELVKANDCRFSQIPCERHRLRDGKIDESALELILEEADLFMQTRVTSPALSNAIMDITALESAVCVEDDDTIEHRISIGTPVELALPTDVETVLSAIIVENPNDHVVEHFRLIANDRDWHDIDAIVATLLRDEPEGEAEGDRALRFLHAYRSEVRGGYKRTSARDQPLTYNPVALFSYFGRAPCGILAGNFVLLCSRIGLRARLRSNATHTYAEVYLNDSWRIFDPHPGDESYYPDRSNRELLGAEDLWRVDPAIFDRVKVPWQNENAPRRKRRRSAAFRSTGGANRILGESTDLLRVFEGQPPLSPAFRMMPRERILIMPRVEAPWYTRVRFSRKNEGSPSMVREFDVMAPGVLEACEHSGLTVAVADGVRSVSAHGQTGLLTVPLDNGFPVVDCAIHVKGGWDDIEQLSLEFQRNDERTSGVRPVRASPGHATFNFRRLCRQIDPGDQASVSLTLAAGTSMTSLRVRSTCQIGDSWVPKLHPGRNVVRFEPAAGAPSDVELVLRYRFHGGEPILDHAGFEAVSPTTGSKIGAAPHKMEWHHPGRGDLAAPLFHLVVAHDSKLLRRLASNFDRVIEGTVLELDAHDRSFFDDGGRYYWAIRQVSPVGATIGRWSNTFDFTIGGSA